MSEKIKPKHLERKAILYVRQSTVQQLINNRESQRLQYGVQDKLRELGWREIEVIDDDLGRSASGSVVRDGFERMVADVGLGKVGIVAARELSRFARNSPEWQQLVGLCRMTDTLLLDHDGIYDSRLSNDCLLLGLKGTINEYELDLFRLRSVEARRQKAQRGEYFARIPAGFCKVDSRLEKDPDRRVRETIDLIFRKFFELGSVRQMVLWFANHKIDIPRNQARGVVWKPVSYGHVINILKNPLYGGAYVFGKTEQRTKLRDGALRKSVAKRRMQDWPTLILDHHEGYISWAQYERIQKMISDNDQIARKRGAAPGAAKRGAALLAGIARCKRCGRMLQTSYSGSRSKSGDGYIQRYACNRATEGFGQVSCISFSAVEVDRRIASEVLAVAQPLAIEAAIEAHKHSQKLQADLHSALTTRLEEAKYRADLAARRYDAIDPANRLVAEELERRWNEALENVEMIESKIRSVEEERHKMPAPPLEEFTNLASDLHTVWGASAPELKTRIVRTVIQEVIADIDASEIVLVIHWKGGAHTELRVPKRKRGYAARRTPVEVVDAVRSLAVICTDDQIARWMNQSGVRTATGLEWSRQLITSLRSEHQIPRFSKERKEAEGWLTQKEAAKLVGVAEVTIHRAVERGDLAALRPLSDGPWLFKKKDLLDAQAANRIKKRSAPRQKASGQILQELLPGISKR